MCGFSLRYLNMYAQLSVRRDTFFEVAHANYFRSTIIFSDIMCISYLAHALPRKLREDKNMLLI